MFRLVFHFNKIHDYVPKASNTASQYYVAMNSQQLILDFDPGFTMCGITLLQTCEIQRLDWPMVVHEFCEELLTFLEKVDLKNFEP